MLFFGEGEGGGRYMQHHFSFAKRKAKIHFIQQCLCGFLWLELLYRPDITVPVDWA